MNKYIKMTALTLLVSLTACNKMQNTRIAYLAVEMPEGPMPASVEYKKQNISSSRISVGFYRPPANILDIINGANTAKNVGVLNNVDVVLQTPVCAFPLLCFGTDKVKFN